MQPHYPTHQRPPFRPQVQNVINHPDERSLRHNVSLRNSQTSFTGDRQLPSIDERHGTRWNDSQIMPASHGTRWTSFQPPYQSPHSRHPTTLQDQGNSLPKSISDVGQLPSIPIAPSSNPSTVNPLPYNKASSSVQTPAKRPLPNPLAFVQPVRANATPIAGPSMARSLQRMPDIPKFPPQGANYQPTFVSQLDETGMLPESKSETRPLPDLPPAAQGLVRSAPNIVNIPQLGHKSPSPWKRGGSNDPETPALHRYGAPILSTPVQSYGRFYLPAGAKRSLPPSPHVANPSSDSLPHRSNTLPATASPIILGSRTNVKNKDVPNRPSSPERERTAAWDRASSLERGSLPSDHSESFDRANDDRKPHIECKNAISTLQSEQGSCALAPIPSPRIADKSEESAPYSSDKGSSPSNQPVAGADSDNIVVAGFTRRISRDLTAGSFANAHSDSFTQEIDFSLKELQEKDQNLTRNLPSPPERQSKAIKPTTAPTNETEIQTGGYVTTSRNDSVSNLSSHRQNVATPRDLSTHSLTFRLASMALEEEKNTVSGAANRDYSLRPLASGQAMSSREPSSYNFEDAPPKPLRKLSTSSPDHSLKNELDTSETGRISIPKLTYNSAKDSSPKVEAGARVPVPTLMFDDDDSDHDHDHDRSHRDERFNSAGQAPSISISSAIPTIDVSSSEIHAVLNPTVEPENLGGRNSTISPPVRKGGLICGGCGKGIVGRIVSAMGIRWHPACFQCSICGELLEHVSAYEHDNRPYCHLDYHERFGPRCYHCQTPIIDEQFITLDDPALGKRTYHEQHFFCAECGDPFLGSPGLDDDDEVGFTVYRGYAYCEACHVRLRMPKCSKCGKSIREGTPAVEALGKKWCKDCFVCAGCDKPFEDPAFFQRANKPFCEACFSIILKSEMD